MFLKKIFLIIILFYLIACSTVPVSGRKQLTIYPDSVLNHQSDSMYYQLIDEERDQRRLVKMNDELHKKLNGMSARIEKGVEQYFIMEGKDYSKAKHDYEINIIKDKRTVNAFAMPTGKIIFYTKILEIAENDKSKISNAYVSAILGQLYILWSNNSQALKYNKQEIYN